MSARASVFWILEMISSLPLHLPCNPKPTIPTIPRYCFNICKKACPRNSPRILPLLSHFYIKDNHNAPALRSTANIPCSKTTAACSNRLQQPEPSSRLKHVVDER
jgi:hypothetical protein